jgi:hypothetical protein
MARRRKKSKKPPAVAAVPKTDKSLPALPPSAAPIAFTPDLDTPSDVFSEPPTADASPRPPQPRRNPSSPAHFRRDASPASFDERGKGSVAPAFTPPTTHLADLCSIENSTLPASTYKEANHSAETSDNGDDGIMLPFALDPNTMPGPSPLNKPAKFLDGREASPSQVAEGKSARDYFNRPATNHRDMLKENRSRSASAERASQSPHIAYQEKGRQQSENVVETLRNRKETESSSAGSRSQHDSPSTSQASDTFKLQDVPKNKKAEARKNSKSEVRSPPYNSPTLDAAGRLKSPPVDAGATASPMLDTQSIQEESPETSSSSYHSTQRVERPVRGESLANSALKPPAARRDLAVTSPTTPTAVFPERKSSTTANISQANGNYSISSPMESPLTRNSTDPPVPPQRSAGRPAPPPTDNFTSPRAPPHPPPPPQSHRPSESVSTLQSETSQNLVSPAGLPRYSAQGDFSNDADFARLLSDTQEAQQEKESGVFRRVSNAVKHGRSFSDRGSITAKGHKKWPTNGSIDISSPTIASPDSREENINLRNELRRSQQRIAELEAEKNGLRESVHSAADIRQANTMLREKRNTMAVLDTQREMVIRELEIMTEHLKRAKENSKAMDINQLKSDILKDFANSLQRLKDQLGGQIEDLISKRSELTDEISNLIQMKDKGFQEYESLSAQNAKLSNMNRDLVESIQRTLKDNKHQNGGIPMDVGRGSANGLGIYQTPLKGGKSDMSIDIAGLTHEPSYSTLHEAESEATLAQPQVVNIRKTGAPKKFNWKKGGQAITKNVTKGFGKAFGPSETRREDEYNPNIKVIGTPYGSVHTQPDFASMASSSMASSSMTSSTRPREEPTPRGWFGGKATTTKPQSERLKMQHSNSSSNLVGGDSSVLFGSDLSARCEFEKRVVPAVVSRCIEEVELRGESTLPF